MLIKINWSEQKKKPIAHPFSLYQGENKKEQIIFIIASEISITLMLTAIPAHWQEIVLTDG